MKSDTHADLKVRNLTLLSESELGTLATLEVTNWQEIKGGSFKESLDAWQSGPSEQILGLGFLLKNNPVGMTLFKRPPLSPSWACANAATIHGLKISLPLQGRRLGHSAFELAVGQLKKEWPEIATLMLAVDADNASALAVYRGFGMIDSGPVFEGPDGAEHRFEISFLP